jgi:tetratricopeptide (TPR) repeat protein
MKYLTLLLSVLCAASAQPQAARDLNARGVAAYARGDYAAAERLYRASAEKWEALGEPFRAHQGITRMNLGDAMAAQGRRQEAQPELERALALLRRSLGTADRNTLDCMNLLGMVYLVENDFDRAGPLLEEALAIEREHLPNDVSLARTLGQIAKLRMSTGQIQGALAPAEESLALAAKISGEDSADAALAYTVVAEAHRLAGRPGRALPLYRRAQTIYEKRLGPEHPRVASLLGQEGLMLAEDGKLASAAQILQRALEMLIHSCPQCTYERSIVDSNLAGVRAGQSRFAEAERLLNEAVALSESAQPQPSAETAGLRQQLAEVQEKEQRLAMAGRTGH